MSQPEPEPRTAAAQPADRGAVLNEAADRLVRLIAAYWETAINVNDSNTRASILKLAEGGEWAAGLLRQWAHEAQQPTAGEQPVPDTGRRSRWAATWIDPAAQDGLTAVHAEAIRTMKARLRAVADEEQQELLKSISDLIASIGYARRELSRVVLGQDEASPDMSLEQVVDAAVGEYRSELAAVRRAMEQRREASAERNNLRTMYDVSERRVHDLIEERDGLRAEVESANESARKSLEQRQELAEERHAWQERGDRAEAEAARLRAALDRLELEIAGLRSELEQARRERGWYRSAWTSARERAAAYGEGILRHVEDRETYQRWLKEAEARIAELEQARATTPVESAHPDKVVFIAEYQEGDLWLHLGTSIDRPSPENLRARTHGMPARLVRATTTYTVEPGPVSEDRAQQQ